MTKDSQNPRIQKSRNYDGICFRKRIDARYKMFFDLIGLETIYIHDIDRKNKLIKCTPDFILLNRSFIKIIGRFPKEREIIKARSILLQYPLINEFHFIIGNNLNPNNTYLIINKHINRIITTDIQRIYPYFLIYKPIRDIYLESIKKINGVKIISDSLCDYNMYEGNLTIEIEGNIIVVDNNLIIGDLINIVNGLSINISTSLIKLRSIVDIFGTSSIDKPRRAVFQPLFLKDILKIRNLD